MSDVLARLRVKEEHGIRRFLYPLWVQIPLADGTNPDLLSLVMTDSQPIPTQGTQRGKGRYRLDFAVSLAPHQEIELHLIHGQQPAIVDDAITFDFAIDVEQVDYMFSSRQKRFSVLLDMQCNISAVSYDGQEYLHDATSVRCNTQTMRAGSTVSRTGDNLVTAWLKTRGCYDCQDHPWNARTRTELTACKSWATVTHKLHTPQTNDEVVFTLPLAVTSPILTYDIGIEGVYGKLEATSEDAMTWRMAFDGPDVQWTVATNDRVDYSGRMSPVSFQGKRWFHLVDSNKSIAVAITNIPSQCRQITAHLSSDGEIRIAFQMGQEAGESAEFGVCYHFLNDVPAIAAATNPQSILLPPTVEVLPA